MYFIICVFSNPYVNFYYTISQFIQFISSVWWVSRINRSHFLYRKSILAFAVSHGEMIKIMKRVPIPGDLSAAHGDGSTWTVFDCREINDLTRIYPFGSLNRRWSEAWLITSALYTERDCLNVITYASCSYLIFRNFYLVMLKFSWTIETGRFILLNSAENTI